MSVASYEGRRVHLDVSGTFSFANGRSPKFVVSELRMGRVPVVGTLRERLCQEIDERLAEALLPGHVHVRRLEITDDSVIIYGDRYAR